MSLNDIPPVDSPTQILDAVFSSTRAMVARTKKEKREDKKPKGAISPSS